MLIVKQMLLQRSAALIKFYGLTAWVWKLLRLNKSVLRLVLHLVWSESSHNAGSLCCFEYSSCKVIIWCSWWSQWISGSLGAAVFIEIFVKKICAGIFFARILILLAASSNKVLWKITLARSWVTIEHILVKSCTVGVRRRLFNVLFGWTAWQTF